MNKKWVVAVALVLLWVFAFIVPVVSADSNKRAKRACCEAKNEDFSAKFFAKAGMMMKKQEELGLSDVQVEQIKDIKMQVNKSLIKADADIKVIGIDIKAALAKDDIDQQAVNAMIDKKYDYKKAKAKVMVGAYVSLNNLLTKEQRAALKGFCKKCKVGKGAISKKRSGKGRD